MKSERTRTFFGMTVIVLLAMLCAFALTMMAFSDLRRAQQRESQNSLALAAIELGRREGAQAESILDALSVGTLRVVMLENVEEAGASARQVMQGQVVWDEKTGQTFFMMGGQLCAVQTQAAKLLPPMIALYLVIMGGLLFLLLLLADKIVTSRLMRLVGLFSDAERRIAEGDYGARIEKNAKMTDQARQMADDFNAMAEKLGSVEYLRRDFTQSVSHEIKTPVAAIHSYAQLLQMDSLGAEEKRACAKAISDQSRRLSGLSDSLLRLTRLESQATLLEKKRCRIGESLREATVSLLPSIEKKHIALLADLPDVSAVVDEQLFVQAYRNLLENAVKFTPEGGSIAVTLRRTPSLLTLDVADNGCGMDEETQAHIFEKFYQADASHATEGVGLGLALVQRIMQMHGGQVEVKSEPGKGSTFRLVLAQEA